MRCLHGLFVIMLIRGLVQSKTFVMETHEGTGVSDLLMFVLTDGVFVQSNEIVRYTH